MENLKWTVTVLVELLLLIVKSIYYIGESIYYMVASLPEKSLADDIVLVSAAQTVESVTKNHNIGVTASFCIAAKGELLYRFIVGRIKPNKREHV